MKISTMPVNIPVTLNPGNISMAKTHLSCLARLGPHGISYKCCHLQSHRLVANASTGRICIKRLQF